MLSENLNSLERNKVVSGLSIIGKIQSVFSAIVYTTIGVFLVGFSVFSIYTHISNLKENEKVDYKDVVIMSGMFLVGLVIISYSFFNVWASFTSKLYSATNAVFI